jgi:hypothetical protein
MTTLNCISTGADPALDSAFEQALALAGRAARAAQRAWAATPLAERTVMVS